MKARILIFLVSCILCHTIVCAEEPEIADSANFVTSSLIVMTPGEASYSSLGHCAIRMECPSAHLDYCFSLETDTSPNNHIRFFTGKAIAGVFGVPTAAFLQPYRDEGRGVVQYELNLSLEENQLLWKNLDEEMVKPPHLRFNFLNTNCVMMCMMMIEGALINESIHFDHLPSYMRGVNGEKIRYITQGNPWQEFVYILLAGAACDKDYDIEYCMSPRTIVEILDSAEIQAVDGACRSVFMGQPVTLVKPISTIRSCRVSPILVFSLLLLIVIIITIARWVLNTQRICHLTDILLMFTQTLTGIVLLYTSTIANLFGTRWNWYLIPFLPLPVLIWLLCHKKTYYYKIYALYSIILGLFICATPFSSQLDWTHQLPVITLMIRTISLYFELGKKKHHFFRKKEKFPKFAF